MFSASLTAAAAPLSLPDAPLPVASLTDAPLPAAEVNLLTADQQAAPSTSSSQLSSSQAMALPQTAPAPPAPSAAAPADSTPVDADGNAIPLERQQPTRILGIMPNFRSVSGGSKPHPPGWKYNFTVATHQSLDYSTFVFLGLTSLSAEGMNAHPSLGKGVDGYWAYTWRGFLDKSDNTYLSAWLLASALHEDTRFYALGSPHRIATRELYVISRQGVTRTYSGHDFPNFAGLGGKVLTQVVSRQYYPSSATGFSVLATKFGYSVMRDVAFSTIREFYPDIAAHYIRKHRAKIAAQQQALVQAQQP